MLHEVVMSRRYCKLLLDLLEEEYVRLGGALKEDLEKLSRKKYNIYMKGVSKRLKRSEGYDPSWRARARCGLIMKSVKTKLYPSVGPSAPHPERFEAESRKETGNWIKLFFAKSRTKTIMDLLDEEKARLKLQKPKDYRKIARIRLMKTKIDPNSEKEFLKLFEESVKKQKATKYKRAKKSKSAIEL